MPKTASTKFAIQPEPNKFDDNFLNVVGNQFKFDHPKGLAEWLKNSADAYTVAGIPDADQFIVLRFMLAQPKNRSIFECIDFVGCTKKDIDDALKIWGSPTAAKRGTNVQTFGGHGNGGKFYMRQMFETAQMITYRGGVLNVFGFDSDHRYGFDKRHTNKSMSLDEALAFAGLDELDIPQEVRWRWKKLSKAGFTVVRGNHPTRFSGRSTLENILEGLRFHPQARRVLRHKNVIVMRHGQGWGERLDGPSVAAKTGFEEPRIVPLPKHLELDGERISTRLSKGGQDGKLIMRTSENPLTGSRELASLNSVDFLGEVGCIGSYRMNELGRMRYAAESEFIYGECECPFLEDPELDCVSNDRDKLIDNPLTQALREWVCAQVDALAEEISVKRRGEKKSRDLAKSSLFNQMLDKWKNKFMARLHVELFGGMGTGGAFGGAGGGGGGGGGGQGGNGQGGQGTNGEDQGQGAGTQGGSGNKSRDAARFPTVLLSGQDRDPLDPAASRTFDLDPRQPPVYQRAIDIDNGIYWINTSRPLANKIIDHHGVEHPRWREYLFQRYLDIIIKQQIYGLAKHDPEFTAEKVDELFTQVTAKVHDAAADDLEQFLFDETLTGAPAIAPAEATTAGLEAE